MTLKKIFANLDQKLFYLFIFLIPFQVSLFLGNINKSWAFYNDFIGFWLYLADILIILILIFSWQKTFAPDKTKSRGINILLVAFLAWTISSMEWAVSPKIALYSAFRLLLMVGLYFYIKKAITPNTELRKKTYLALFISGVIQSIIGIWQFIQQKSIGLRLIGEPIFNQATNGIAKLDYNGGKLVRAYGTFPHPNILGGFLFLAIGCGILIFIKSPLIPLFQRRKAEHNDTNSLSLRGGYSRHGNLEIAALRLLALLAITTIISCLVLTFSRSTWLASGLFLVSSAIYFYKNKFSTKSIKSPLIPFFQRGRENRQSVSIISTPLSIIPVSLPIIPVSLPVIPASLSVIPAKAGISIIKIKKWILVFTGITAIIFIIIFTVSPIKNRLVSYQEAIATRAFTTQLAIEIIKQKPILGAGWSNFIPQALELTKNQALEPWQIQPVHNIYLLVFAELGIVGLALFLAFIFQLLRQTFAQIKSSPEQFILFSLFCGLLLIGMFDHYLLTLPQGMIMFWLSAGLIN